MLRKKKILKEIYGGKGKDVAKPVIVGKATKDNIAGTNEAKTEAEGGGIDAKSDKGAKRHAENDGGI